MKKFLRFLLFSVCFIFSTHIFSDNQVYEESSLQEILSLDSKCLDQLILFIKSANTENLGCDQEDSGAFGEENDFQLELEAYAHLEVQMCLQLEKSAAIDEDLRVKLSGLRDNQIRFLIHTFIKELSLEGAFNTTKEIPAAIVVDGKEINTSGRPLRELLTEGIDYKLIGELVGGSVVVGAAGAGVYFGKDQALNYLSKIGEGIKPDAKIEQLIFTAVAIIMCASVDLGLESLYKKLPAKKLLKKIHRKTIEPLLIAGFAIALLWIYGGCRTRAIILAAFKFFKKNGGGIAGFFAQHWKVAVPVAVATTVVGPKAVARGAFKGFELLGAGVKGLAGASPAVLAGVSLVGISFTCAGLCAWKPEVVRGLASGCSNFTRGLPSTARNGFRNFLQGALGRVRLPIAGFPQRFFLGTRHVFRLLGSGVASTAHVSLETVQNVLDSLGGSFKGLLGAVLKPNNVFRKDTTFRNFPDGRLPSFHSRYSIGGNQNLFNRNLQFGSPLPRSTRPLNAGGLPGRTSFLGRFSKSLLGSNPSQFSQQRRYFSTLNGPGGQSSRQPFSFQGGPHSGSFSNRF